MPSSWVKRGFAVVGTLTALSTAAYGHEHMEAEAEASGKGPFFLTLSYYSTRSFAPLKPFLVPPDHSALQPGPSGAAAAITGDRRVSDAADMPPPAAGGPLITRTTTLMAEWEAMHDLYLRFLESYNDYSGTADPAFGAEYDHELRPQMEAVLVATSSLPLAKNRLPGQHKLTTFTLSAGIERDWEYAGWEASMVTIRSLHSERGITTSIDATGIVLEADAYLYQWKLFTTMAYLYPGAAVLVGVRPAVSLGIAYLFD